jgi:hypothetical protein
MTMQIQHSITRRHALATTIAGALSIATIPAAAEDQDQAEWLAMWQAYIDQEQRHVAATDAHYGAEHAAEQEYPEPPECLWQKVDGEPRRNWHGAIRPLSRSDIDALFDKQLRLAALATWEGECAAVDARFNVPALKAAHEAEYDRYEALERGIIDKPATGMSGVAIKLAVWARTELTDTLECAGGKDHPEGQQWLGGPAVAAWHDALRLAGLPDDMGLVHRGMQS